MEVRLEALRAQVNFLVFFFFLNFNMFSYPAYWRHCALAVWHLIWTLGDWV